MKHNNIKENILLLFVLICILGLFAFSLGRYQGMSETEASRAFMSYVLNPTPESVTNIRADQPKKIRGYRYTFRFNINRDDLALLINSRPFMKVWNIKNNNGLLSWDWDRDGPLGMAKHRSWMVCYNQSARKPDWFRPGLWDNPEIYAFWRDGDLVNVQVFGKDSRGPVEIRVLLYNEHDAEAYFIVTYREN